MAAARAGMVEQMAAIVEASEDAIFRATPSGVLQFWSKGAERLYGWTAAEAIGSHISLIVQADRVQEDERVLAAVQLGPEVRR